MKGGIFPKGRKAGTRRMFMDDGRDEIMHKKEEMIYEEFS